MTRYEKLDMLEFKYGEKVHLYYTDTHRFAYTGNVIGKTKNHFEEDSLRVYVDAYVSRIEKVWPIHHIRKYRVKSILDEVKRKK
jgi:hypothetical protein